MRNYVPVILYYIFVLRHVKTCLAPTVWDDTDDRRRGHVSRCSKLITVTGCSTNALTVLQIQHTGDTEHTCNIRVWDVNFVGVRARDIAREARFRSSLSSRV